MDENTTTESVSPVSPAPEPEKKQPRSSRTALKYGVCAVVFLVIGLALGSVMTGSITGYTVSETTDTDIGPEAAGSKLVTFLQTQLAERYPGIEIAVADIIEYEPFPSIYEVTLTITFQGQSQDIPYYVTKDGTNMFSGAAEVTDQQHESSQQTPETGVATSDRPTLDVFVMSYCPYGLQMQKALVPVMELLGDKADITVRWVNYIMHDKQEIDENTRQHCIQKEQPDVYIPYLRCFTIQGDVEACLAEANVDTAALDTCIAATDQAFNITGLYNDRSTWRGGSFPVYPIDNELNAQYGVGGSPTFVLNGQTLPVTRSPEAIKQVVCSAFTEPPEECSEVLSDSVASPGFGGSIASASSQGSC